VKALTRDPILKKGTVIGWDWWFVVIEVTVSGHVHCICDNANNIYSFESKEILDDEDPHEWLLIQPEEFDEISSLFVDLDNKYHHLLERDLPFHVVVEALSGEHDERFKHWSGNEPPG